MNETYKFLQKTITRNWTTKTNEELCKIYQETKDNEILAYMFCKNFSLWKKLINKYGFFVNSDEISSYILEYIDIMLKSYNFEINNNFIKYAIIGIRNKLISLNRHFECKRRLERETISYNNIVENDESDENEYFNSLVYKDNLDDADTELDIDKNMQLNEKEKVLCKLVLSGEAVNKLEIAVGLKKNRLTVYNYIKSLQQKLLVNDEYLRG